MLLLKWILFIVLGRLIIHIWQQFYLPKFLAKIEWFVKLHECDLCSGVWIYAILSMFLGVDVLSILIFDYVPLVSEVLTGIVVSWLVHIFVLGWRAKYEVVVV